MIFDVPSNPSILCFCVLSQLWYLCKGDWLVFPRHENHIEGNCSFATGMYTEAMVRELGSVGKRIATEQGSSVDMVKQQCTFLTMLQLIAKLLFLPTTLKLLEQCVRV